MEKIRFIYSSIIMLMLALCPVAVKGSADAGYLHDIDIDGQSVTRKDGKVNLKMTVDMSRLKLNTQQSVALTPVVVSADGNREAVFPAVVIDGKTRYKVYLRSQSLKSVPLPPMHDGNSALAVICRRNGSEQSYGYEASIPYERWMSGASVRLREQVYGCANCRKGESSRPLPGAEQALAPVVPVFRVEKVIPEPEPVKERGETRTARLQFRQNSSKIDPAFKSNREELDRVISSIKMVNDNRDLTITGIYVTGYASPEGTEAYNLKLSQTRADALAAYIRENTGVADSLWHVTGAGEDWEGLRREVEKHPRLLKQAEVLRIIDECDGNRDECERRLMNLMPPEIYTRLVNEMYGPLRRNEYRIEYTVRQFDIEEAKRQIKERPDLLSVEEIYKVADTYGVGSEGYCEALLTAARAYPENVAAVVNGANIYLDRGDIASAIKLLEGCPRSDAPEVLNALGVAYCRDGRSEKGAALLRRAAATASPEAQENLRQLELMTAD